MSEETYIQNLFAERIGGSQYGKTTAIYKFEKIKRAKKAALEANPGAEIIDMGVGEPDAMAFPEVIEILHTEASKLHNRGYADNGDEVMKLAAARYLDRVVLPVSTQPLKSYIRLVARQRFPSCRQLLSTLVTSC